MARSTFREKLKKAYKNLIAQEQIFYANVDKNIYETAVYGKLDERQKSYMEKYSESYIELQDILNEEFTTEGRDDTTPRK